MSDRPGPRGPFVVAALIAAGLLASCGGGGGTASSRPASASGTPAPTPGAARYVISPAGGTPATGPGNRWNECERIWCTSHGENYFVDHFLAGHTGWVIHDDLRGDVWVPRHRTEGPEFPDAADRGLLLCGRHVHPYMLGRGRGPIHYTGYNPTLGYGRDHFASYGTRLDPCCVNGLGWGFLHSRAGRRFPFHDVQPYRDNPEIGWHKPFQARPR